MNYIISHDGLPIYYRTLGFGSKPVIIMHGFGMNNSHWLPILWHLRHDYTFFMPDLRGFGQSKDSFNYHGDVLQSHADDLKALIDGLKLKKPIAVGYSLGGLSLLKFIHRHGEGSLGGFVFIDVHCAIKPVDRWQHSIFGDQGCYLLRHWSLMRRQIRSHYAGDLKDVAFDTLHEHHQKMLLKALSRFMRFAVSDGLVGRLFYRIMTLESFIQFMFPMDYWHVFVGHAESFVDHNYDFTDEFASIKKPLFLMSGEKSRVFPIEGQQEMTQINGNCGHYLLSDSGHIPMIDQPFEFMSALETGLKGA